VFAADPTSRTGGPASRNINVCRFRDALDGATVARPDSRSPPATQWHCAQVVQQQIRPSIMSDPAVIDPQTIENLRSLNPGDNDEFLREIAGIFFEDTPQRIAELDESLAAKDVIRFTRAAHSIKGSSANLGAVLLRAAAEKLEHQSRTAGLAGVEPLLVQLKSEFARAEAALAKLVGK
jgi:HPt (histidine-containing phosphotransfer) domain-containing protein